MKTPRYGGTATLLYDGTVLAAGIDTPRDAPPILAETYNPTTRQWTPTGSGGGVLSAATANRLPNGNVLMAGGWEPPPPTDPGYGP